MQFLQSIAAEFIIMILYAIPYYIIRKICRKYIIQFSQLAKLEKVPKGTHYHNYGYTLVGNSLLDSSLLSD